MDFLTVSLTVVGVVVALSLLGAAAMWAASQFGWGQPAQ